MPKVEINHEILLRGSKDGVVVIAVMNTFSVLHSLFTGGTGGIGEELLQLFYHSGSHIFFCDVSEKKGRELEERLRRNPSPSGELGLATFTALDIRDYDAQVSLFHAAFTSRGRVDLAIYCVGISGQPGWMGSTSLNLETVQKTPKPLGDVLDINLTGCLYFSRVTTAYLRQGTTPGSDGKSLTLISSANGILEAPGLYTYAASKAGMLGILRSFRTISRANFGFRVNVVCPMATDTRMIARAKDYFAQAQLPVNSAKECARVIQQVAVGTRHHGEAVIVVENQGVDVEAGLRATRPQWMGEQLIGRVDKEQVHLDLSRDWGDLYTIE